MALCRLELQAQGVDVLLSAKEPAKRKRKAASSTPTTSADATRDSSPDSVVLDEHVRSKVR